MSLVRLNYDTTSFLNMIFRNPTNDDTPDNNMFQKNMSTLVGGGWLGIAWTMDVQTTSPGGFIGGALYLPTSLNTANLQYPFRSDISDLSNPSLKLSLCAGIGGSATVGCQISNLKVIYKTYSSKIPLIFGQNCILYFMSLSNNTIAVQLMGFPFKEGAGYQTQNSINPTTPSYFGKI
jgi:hypothetical protein